MKEKRSIKVEPAGLFRRIAALVYDIFLIAAEREKASHEFYRKLAELQPEGAFKTVLDKLAQEELAHKEKVEYLYCNAAFPQTDGG